MAVKVDNTSSGCGFVPTKYSYEPPVSPTPTVDMYEVTVEPPLTEGEQLSRLQALMVEAPALTPPAPRTILDQAAEIVGGDRRRDYGHPRDNFELIAQFWSAALKIHVTPRMVGRLMILMKMARDIHTPKADNLVDTAGYARTMEILDEAA